MTRNWFQRSWTRAALVLSTTALGAAFVTAPVNTATVSAAGGPADTAVPSAAGVADEPSYINYVAPKFDRPTGHDAKIDRRTGSVSRPPDDALAQAYAVDAKHARGNPTTARQLARLEARAIRTGKSPKELKRQYKNAKRTQTAKLLTILVEFNDEAGDDFTGVQVPKTVFGDRTCVDGTVQNGPLHNNIPDPADAAHLDNNTMWVPDFSSEHFNKMLFTDEGITERVRPDLTGPDGQPGIDISGFTMKRMYEEMSKGAYTVDGAATPWVEVPHSEGWYGASRCSGGEAPIPQAMQGHPDNPKGPGQLAIDAVAALAAEAPDFPWDEYDIEDQGDVDNDGDFFEPDGVIDHVVLVHAGEDKSGGGGAEGVYSIWAHSSTVVGGAAIPGTDLRLANYIVQPEDSGVGVFAHEYGHDLGLPDLYDTSGNADSDVDFWDLMSSGSHSGPIFQSMPTHMGLWDKWVLGWADPVEINPGDDPRSVIVGQTSRTPRGTKDGIKVNLPTKVVTLAEPHSGEQMWYSGADQDWADVRLARSVDVPAGGDVRFWMWNNYLIEADWDYGFVEVSADGGATWSQANVFDEAGNLVSTADDYDDPNGRLSDYGGLEHGLTGDSGGWRHDWVDLTPYAGQTVQVRLRYATDAAFLERGWFADDLSVTADGATVWSDDAEANNGWTSDQGTFTDTTGAGWHLDTGTSRASHYYLVEWRNYDGFDAGLQYAYESTYTPVHADGCAPECGWNVAKIPYNAPGALMWYRDTTWGNNNHVSANLFSLPSTGSKGGLLVVDSHFDPLRRTGASGDLDPTLQKNAPSRTQSSNAAFGLQPTQAFDECLAGADFVEACTTFGPQSPVSAFTDAQTWYPGIELRDEGLFFRDFDGSVVIPSVDNQVYSTRITDPNGAPMPELYGTDIGLPSLLGSGNPGDDGVAFDTVISVEQAKQGNTSARIHVTPPKP